MVSRSIETIAKLERARKQLDGSIKASVADTVGGELHLIEEDRRAAILIAVRGGFLDAWSRREELSTTLYERLDSQPSRTPNGPVPLNYQEIDRTQPIEHAVCSNCRIRPGFGPCPRCSGVGVLIVSNTGSDNTTVQDCPACDDGFARCTVCGGSARVVRATLRYVDYKPFDTNHVVGGRAVEALREAFPPPAAPPEDLAYDLEGADGQSAYRGQLASLDRAFHGYAFGDAVKQARAFVRRVQAAPNFKLRELRTYALPFVAASYQGPSRDVHVALVVWSDGNPLARIVSS